ncbi:d4.2 [Ichnoviriform fugitivi]|uniref:D4.2 n=1 Tax=Ichnoviriform fugitivi TaxID=265522 RepID=A2Q0K8_9VIRU|nr:d4.2 [Ichnoviriform fugitivi]BAF45723.1 d4.2 [Ichnoviriform fugitivi]
MRNKNLSFNTCRLRLGAFQLEHTSAQCDTMPSAECSNNRTVPHGWTQRILVSARAVLPGVPIIQVNFCISSGGNTEIFCSRRQNIRNVVCRSFQETDCVPTSTMTQVRTVQHSATQCRVIGKPTLFVARVAYAAPPLDMRQYCETKHTCTSVY